jgi:hypothetical protein
MTRALSILKFVCLAALTAAGCWFLAEGALTQRDVRSVVPLAKSLLTDARRTVLVLGGAATNVEKILREERTASKAQFEAGTQSLIAGRKLIEQGTRSIATIEGKVTGELIPSAKAALDSVPQLSIVAATSLTKSNEELQPTLKALARGAASFAEAMGDPRIKETLGHVTEASANVERLTAESAATMKNVEAISVDARNYVHKALAGPRGIYNGLKEVVDWAFKLKGLVP